jgi:hypothetical protein
MAASTTQPNSSEIVLLLQERPSVATMYWDLPQYPDEAVFIKSEAAARKRQPWLSFYGAGLLSARVHAGTGRSVTMSDPAF